MDPDPRPFDTLGRTWETLNVGFKPYPACHYLQRVPRLRALSLRETHRLDVDADRGDRVPGATDRDADRRRAA